MASMDDLKMDIQEMEKIAGSVSRQRVKGILSIELHKMRTQLSKLMDEQKSQQSGDVNTTKPADGSAKRYVKSITNYAWDQSEKFMKIYVTLNAVQGLPKEDVTVQFTDNSFQLFVSDLNNCDHQCHIVNLFEDIIPEKSYHKVKTDSVLLMLKKNSEKTWAYVTKQEAKGKDKKPAPVGGMNDGGDPQESMMNLMQQMYEDGDDEMKRTIAKSMYESRNKSTAEL